VASRPTGTVSFLFTDIAGSTRLWDDDQESMAASVAAHDRILRTAIGDHGGYVFSTAGDSFGAAFTTAAEAIAAAVQSQLGLVAETWSGPPIRVRMGIHTGSSEERASDYFGPHVNRAARVMSAANGGQILVSGVTAELVVAALPAPMTLADRGTHSLKDLDRPEHLFEVLHPDLPVVEEPLKTSDAIGSRLPAQLTTFIGRHEELESVDALLRGSRLVTLTGVGGTGKTRLSIEAASLAQQRFRDGVWMVELAPVADPALVINEVAQLWGLRPGDGVPLLQVMKAYLASRGLLLVMDNCEHVLEAAATFISEILTSSPGVAVLATSRESLGVPGEAVFRVPSLGLPSDEESAADSDAVQLFLDRAGRVRPGFDSSVADMEAILRICRRLDGIPLGIELAAARLRTLSERELADRLENSFRILTGGSKTAVPRQRTLQTAIDWSYDLLDPEEAALFRRLAVFAGGFDLAAAESVGGTGRVEPDEVLDLLDHLVDKSLVVAAHDEPGSRFRLLEPIRQYGQERLGDEGEAEEAHLAHARYYADLVATVSVQLRGPDQKQANADLMAEIDNIRSALDTLIETDAGVFLETCFDLWWFWAQSSLQVEGRDTVLPGLARASEDANQESVAKGWWLASALAVFLTDPKGVEYAEKGLEVASSAGEETLMGWLGVELGMAQANVGDRDEIGDWLVEGRRLIEGSDGPPIWDDEWDAAFLRFMLGFGGDGSRSDQLAHTTEAIARFEALGDNYLKASAMAASSYLVGEDEGEWALSTLADSVELLRELGFKHGLGHSLFYFGARSQDFGRDDGLEELAEAATMLAEVGDVPCSTWSAARLIRALLDQARWEEARLHLNAAAERLLVFDREVDSDLVILACRASIAAGELDAAGRFLGHAESSDSSDPELAECRVELEAGLDSSRLAALETEGAAADSAVVLRWISGMTQVSRFRRAQSERA
jgi:predicted ATPase/class 3 adenylate cyclase